MAKSTNNDKSNSISRHIQPTSRIILADALLASFVVSSLLLLFLLEFVIVHVFMSCFVQCYVFRVMHCLVA